MFIKECNVDFISNNTINERREKIKEQTFK